MISIPVVVLLCLLSAATTAYIGMIISLPKSRLSIDYYERSVVKRELIHPDGADESITLSCGHNSLLKRHVKSSFPCYECHALGKLESK